MTGRCRSCGAAVDLTLVDLGPMPVANDLRPTAAAARDVVRHPLHVRVCRSCRLAQIDDAVTPAELFDDYAYFSSYSDTWLAHARSYAEDSIGRFGLDGGSRVVELASNDGYLLRWFAEAGIPALGVEPAANVAAVARQAGIETVVDFFGADAARRLRADGVAADLLVANNVLAHVPDPNDFVSGMALLLDPGGTATIEFPHLLRLLEGTQFDTIYHEHYSYFSLLAVEPLLARHGLTVCDLVELPTHGGSLRLVVRPADAATEVSDAVERVRAGEAAADLATDAPYIDFDDAVAACIETFRRFLDDAAGTGRRVAGYGAAAKASMLLNAASIDDRALPFVADRSPHKIGRFLPGCAIPIVAPEVLVDAAPDVVVVFPWNLAPEVAAQLRPDLPHAEIVTAVPAIRRWA